MIISEDHVLQKELNNLTRILLAGTYPLHLIIKISFDPQPQLSVIPMSTTDSNILPNVTLFSRQTITTTIYKNWHTIPNDTKIFNLTSQTFISL